MIWDVWALKTFQKYLLQNGFWVVLLEEYEKLLWELEKEEKFHLERIEESKNASLHELKESERILGKDIENLENELHETENQSSLLVGWIKKIFYKYLFQEKIWMESLLLWLKEIQNTFRIRKENTIKINSLIKSISNEKRTLIKVKKELEQCKMWFYTVPQNLRENYRRIANRKNILSNCKNYYYWAIWEEKVKETIKRIQIDSTLINDFHINIEKWISMKWWNDWIYSLQIDHVAVNEKWIFLIETKNRSNETKNSHTFSPTYQTKRHWHWFYWYFQKDFSRLIGRTPKIYNILIMDWRKIESEEKWVYVLNLWEVNRFILSRTNNLSKWEVDKIKEFLLRKIHR